MSDRGQSHVVGVTLLMGITVVALAGLTAGIGTLVESNAASADSTRVADDIGAALGPVETTGHDRGTVRFTGGRLETVEREVRIVNESGVVRRVAVGGLVFEAGDRRVSYVDDAIVRRRGTNAWLHEPPSLTTGRDGGVLIASVARLNASDVAVEARSAPGSGGQPRDADRGAAVTLETDVTHERTALGNDTYGVAIETATPRPLERWFRERNATVTRRDFDDDGVESVVGRFRGNRTGYLVVHDMHLEVGNG